MPVASERRAPRTLPARRHELPARRRLIVDQAGATAGSVRRRRRDPEPEGSRRVAEPADKLDLAQHAARRALGPIAARFELAVALRAARAARLDLDQAGGRDVDGRRG